MNGLKQWLMTLDNCQGRRRKHLRSASCSSYPRDGEPKQRTGVSWGTGKRSNFRPANPAGFGGQGTLEKGAAAKKPSKTAYKFPSVTWLTVEMWRASNTLDSRRPSRAQFLGGWELNRGFRGFTIWGDMRGLVQFSHVVMSNSTTLWTAARQASLSCTVSQSLLKFMSIESMMTSNHLILCHPLVLLPSIFPSIRFFRNELALCIRWPRN